MIYYFISFHSISSNTTNLNIVSATYLQQKNVQRLKPKIREHTETKMIFKPLKIRFHISGWYHCLQSYFYLSFVFSCRTLIYVGHCDTLNYRCVHRSNKTILKNVNGVNLQLCHLDSLWWNRTNFDHLNSHYP
jgi:hypothetical protein